MSPCKYIVCTFLCPQHVNCVREYGKKSVIVLKWFYNAVMRPKDAVTFCLDLFVLIFSIYIQRTIVIVTVFVTKDFALKSNLLL